MTDTYGEIMARLLDLREKAPERFMRFYNAVWQMCDDLPNGQQFRIADRCAEKAIALFRDIVAIYIMEQSWEKYRGLLELSDDMEWVRRGIGLRPPRPAPPVWNPHKG